MESDQNEVSNRNTQSRGKEEVDDIEMSGDVMLNLKEALRANLAEEEKPLRRNVGSPVLISPNQSSGIRPSIMTPRPGSKPMTKAKFTSNFREMALASTHVSDEDKQKLDYSIIPLLKHARRIATFASIKFAFIKYVFLLLSVGVPALIGLSQYIEEGFGKMWTIIFLASLSVLLTITAKMYDSSAKAYASYNTGFSLMQQETTAFFFLTNDYNEHKHPFKLFVSRILAMTTQISKTDIITTPIDSSYDSLAAEIDHMEKALEKRADSEHSFDVPHRDESEINI